MEPIILRLCVYRSIHRQTVENPVVSRCLLHYNLKIPVIALLSLTSDLFCFQIHANCRIRRVYFSDRLYSEDELPAEFKLYLPVQNQKAKVSTHLHVLTFTQIVHTDLCLVRKQPIFSPISLAEVSSKTLNCWLIFLYKRSFRPFSYTTVPNSRWGWRIS